MKRVANAVWKGSIRAGEGKISTGSGILTKLLYVTGTSNGEVPSTTSTEMLAASEAACMAVSVARELEEVKTPYDAVDASAEITVNLAGKTPEITRILVEVSVHTEDGDPALIEKAIEHAKKNGVVTKVLNCEVIVNAKVLPRAVHA